MGFLDRIKTRLDERRAAELQRTYQGKMDEWQRELALIQATIDIVEEGGMSSDHPDWDFPIRPQKGETLYAAIPGVALVEPRRLRGEWQGGSRGVSVRIAKGISYRVGNTRGTYTPGDEVMTHVDEGGTVYVTDRRVVYLGMKRTLEWKFANLLGYQHDEEVGATFLQVSNRQKVSGFAYGPGNTMAVELRLAAALSHYNDTAKDYLLDLREELAEVNSRRPTHPDQPGG